MHQSFLKKIVMVMIKFKITSVYIKVIFVRIIIWEKLDYSLPSRTMGKGGKGGIKNGRCYSRLIIVSETNLYDLHPLKSNATELVNGCAFLLCKFTCQVAFCN